MTSSCTSSHGLSALPATHSPQPHLASHLVSQLKNYVKTIFFNFFEFLILKILQVCLFFGLE